MKDFRSVETGNVWHFRYVKKSTRVGLHPILLIPEDAVDRSAFSLASSIALLLRVPVTLYLTQYLAHQHLEHTPTFVFSV